MNQINGIWLTLNHQCNMRCKWCYEESQNYDRSCMTEELANNLIVFSSKIKAKTIVLIGGEPTLYNNIHTLVHNISAEGMNASLVTNGIKLSEEKYLKELIENGLKTVNLSIKGRNSAEYQELCCSQEFYKVQKAIKNLSLSGIPYQISIVISKYNSMQLIDYIDELFRGLQIKPNVHLSFCSPTFNKGGYNAENDCALFPEEYIQNFCDQYEGIDAVTEGRFILEQSLPLCYWNNDIIVKMKKKKQLRSVCFVLKRNGLVFDPEGNLLLCNLFPDFKLGQYGKDFVDVNTFQKYFSRSDLEKIYKSMTALPSRKCTECNDYCVCAGGCPAQWFKYSFKEQSICKN